MCYYVLKQNGRIIARSIVRPTTKEEWTDVTEQNMRLHFDKEIAEINSAFDETLIHNAPNEEMEEPLCFVENVMGLSIWSIAMLIQSDKTTSLRRLL